jgi:hypothetical protein
MNINHIRESAIVAVDVLSFVLLK